MASGEPRGTFFPWALLISTTDVFAPPACKRFDCLTVGWWVLHQNASVSNIAIPAINRTGANNDLKKLNIKAKLYLNKDQRKSLHDDIKFKATILNRYKPKYYIDDDDFMNRLLQPHLTDTKCITTEQYYAMRGGLYEKSITQFQI